MTDAIEHLLAQETWNKQLLEHQLTLHQAFIHQTQLHALQSRLLTTPSPGQTQTAHHHTVTAQHIDVDV